MAASAMPAADLTVAVDIGGTFTDIALADGAGRVWRAKTPSTPHDPSEAFLTGIRLALSDAGRAASELTRVLHGTTVATNMMLEDKGAKTALVTTAGFRHVLTIARQDIPRAANLYHWQRRAAPVPASRILEVTERIGADGAALVPLDEPSVRAAAARIRAMGVEAVAVCLLHAFANPAHEARAAEILREELPDHAVTASGDVLPEIREYERSLATVLNATVMPGVSRYVARLEERLAEDGVDAPLLLMQSNGGAAGAAAIRRAPALTALSGPAAGVVGAKAVAEACGVQNILTVDIGGTSADICLMKGARIGLTQRGAVGDWRLSLPMVDMTTIGAGGGSLARVRDGALVVGPESAGATPGPAAYGRGGTEPTVTDAHAVLGHLPERLLGGRMALDLRAARRAVETHVAIPLGLSVEDAARGILAIADNAMVGALRKVSVERGHDPRDFTLAPFGGAGPLHGCALAELIGAGQVMIAPAPGVLCADGLLHAELRTAFSRTLPAGAAFDAAGAEASFDALVARAEAWLDAERAPAGVRRIEKVALMRFHGQGAEIAVPWGAGREDAEAAFRGAHQRLNGFVLAAPVEIVTLRVEASSPAPERGAETPAPGAARPAPRDRARMHLETGPAEVPVWDRADFGPGSVVEGPGIIAQLDATTLLRPGWRAECTASGALLLRRTD